MTLSSSYHGLINLPNGREKVKYGSVPGKNGSEEVAKNFLDADRAETTPDFDGLDQQTLKHISLQNESMTLYQQQGDSLEVAVAHKVFDSGNGEAVPVVYESLSIHTEGAVKDSFDEATAQIQKYFDNPEFMDYCAKDPDLKLSTIITIANRIIDKTFPDQDDAARESQINDAVERGEGTIDASETERRDAQVCAQKGYALYMIIKTMMGETEGSLFYKTTTKHANVLVQGHEVDGGGELPQGLYQYKKHCDQLAENAEKARKAE